MSVSNRNISVPAREGALLWVGANRMMGVHMALSGGVLATLVTVTLLTRKNPVLWIHIPLLCMAGLIALVGVRMALRRAPLLAADERGIVVCTLVRSLIPWELIDGAEVVGAGKNGQHLVIVSRDVEAALKQMSPAIAASVRKLNETWKKPGVAYVFGKTMGEPVEAVAGRINAIIGEHAPV